MNTASKDISSPGNRREDLILHTMTSPCSVVGRPSWSLSGVSASPTRGPWGRQAGGKQGQKAVHRAEPGVTTAGCVISGKAPALSVLGVSSSGNERLAGDEGCYSLLGVYSGAPYRGSSLDLLGE